MTTDLARGRIVLFGGYGGTPSVSFSDTWEWNGTNWSKIPVATHPPARIHTALVWDSVRRQVVSFGGIEAGGDGRSTWEYDGTNWAQVGPVTASPAARWAPAMAYDPGRSRTLLYSGASSPEDRANTWELDGAVWESRAATGPTSRAGAVAAYDAASSRVLLFGGHPLPAARVNDTWTWNGTQWTQQTPTTSPSGRSGHGISSDSARRRLVLFGGADNSNRYLRDMWEWTGSDWLALQPTVSPLGRVCASLAFDSRRARTLLFGGQDGARELDDTWELPSNRPPRLTATVAPVVPVTEHEVVLTAAFNDPDGDAPSWRWFQTFGPPVDLRGDTTAQAKFRAEVPGRFGFEVTAADGHGAHAYALASVTVVGNRSPVAGVAPNAPVLVDYLVQLVGSGVDPDGDAVRFLWLPEAGNPVAIPLTNATSAIASFTPTAAGTYRFQLTATDSFGAADLRHRRNRPGAPGPGGGAGGPRGGLATHGGSDDGRDGGDDGHDAAAGCDELACPGRRAALVSMDAARRAGAGPVECPGDLLADAAVDAGALRSEARGVARGGERKAGGTSWSEESAGASPRTPTGAKLAPGPRDGRRKSSAKRPNGSPEGCWPSGRGLGAEPPSGIRYHHPFDLRADRSTGHCRPRRAAPSDPLAAIRPDRLLGHRHGHRPGQRAGPRRRRHPALARGAPGAAHRASDGRRWHRELRLLLAPARRAGRQTDANRRNGRPSATRHRR